MLPQEDLQRACQSAEPARIFRSLVNEWFRQGLSSAAIYSIFDEFLIQLRSDPNHLASVEEALLDVMDALAGWCHPSAELPIKETLPQPPTLHG